MEKKKKKRKSTIVPEILFDVVIHRPPNFEPIKRDVVHSWIDGESPGNYTEFYNVDDNTTEQWW